ncbi:MAG: amidohydrolase, partial [Acidobacteria bacterium]
MRKIFLSIICFIAVAMDGQNLSPEVSAFVKVNAPTVALTHVRIIDGTGAPPREDQTIVLSNGKISSIADSPSASVPPNAQTLDMHDHAVIPGLVGMHDHLFYPMGDAIFGEMGFSFPRLYLAAGVTTIRTGGSIEPYTDL